MAAFTSHYHKPHDGLNEGARSPIADPEKLDDRSQGGELSAEHKALTRKILLKLDIQIIPIMAILFLCSFLDRTNVGNAKLYNMEADIHITDHQYDTGLVIYYATYIASEIPSNLVLKRLSPRIWLPFLTVAWGIITMCLGFVKNYAGFMTVRAFLGLAEGGLLPGIVLYLSGMYTRGEMIFRIGLFYVSASLSGSFGGLLARGLHEIGTRGGLSGWRWIFVIEGLLTVVAGAAAYFILPNNLHTAGCLTPEERIFAQQRLLRDRPGFVSPRQGSETLEHEPEKFSWSEVRRGIFNVQLWLSGTAYFSILAGLYSFGLFIPTIIVGMGYSANAAQLWSVIPYAVAAVLTVIIAIISDRLQVRGIIMLFTLPLAIIGYGVISSSAIHSSKVKYGVTFLMTTGMYASVPCVLGWNSNNSAGHYKRATTTAAQLAIANSGGFVAAFIYPKKQGPNFREGHRVILGLLCYSWVAVAANVLWVRRLNRLKAEGRMDAFRGCGDDRDPEFRMVL